jgi:oligoribonuclease NrnB/cAMP/cGMP phosphodiesterase (DHH superfamily)
MYVCIYHSADLDGHCSGAIWDKAHEDVPRKLIGLDYGQDIPWEQLEGNDVTMLDFCFQPMSEFIRLLAVASSVTWIDHHKSAIESWQQTETPEDSCSLVTSLDTTQAACELAWSFYFEAPMPAGVFLLGDYDCWRHSNDNTMPYQMGMRLYDMDPMSLGAMARWDRVFGEDKVWYETVLAEGHTILKYQRQQNAMAADRLWFPVQFAGKRWMAVNQGGINSKFWDSVWDDAYDGMLSFVWSGKHWTVSLYSTKFDCGQIAKNLGGGGHAGAAGFQSDQLPFDIKERG